MIFERPNARNCIGNDVEDPSFSSKNSIFFVIEDADSESELSFRDYAIFEELYNYIAL